MKRLIILIWPLVACAIMYGLGYVAGKAKISDCQRDLSYSKNFCLETVKTMYKNEQVWKADIAKLETSVTELETALKTKNESRKPRGPKDFLYWCLDDHGKGTAGEFEACKKMVEQGIYPCKSITQPGCRVPDKKEE